MKRRNNLDWITVLFLGVVVVLLACIAALLTLDRVWMVEDGRQTVEGVTR